MKKKKFNVTGTCYPELHYMMDNSAKLAAVMELIEEGAYFTINRPRQYGKTTMLYFIERTLADSEEYLVIPLNFQGIEEEAHLSDNAFATMFGEELFLYLETILPQQVDFWEQTRESVVNMRSLSRAITAIVNKIPQKLILLIDEVDASSNYRPFLTFLGVLRAKYLARMSAHQRTFHSVILVGVHDIKNLKFKLRNPEEAQYNSPWNIATQFDVIMSFNSTEIATMLQEYSEAEEVKMDISAIAERLYYMTSGYPFLVSRLCAITAERILPKRAEKNWRTEDVDKAVQQLLKEDNTNFDSLTQNLQNHKDLYDLVYQLIILGETITFNSDNTVIQKGITYGIFKLNGRLKINNRIYEQRIYNLLVSNVEINLKREQRHSHRHQFLLPNNELNIEKLLLKFQQFIKEQYSNRDRKFLEREWRLLFLAFIQPVLNGEGYAFKEPQFEQEKQLDIVITYYQHRYIIELKKWYGQVYHTTGINQLVNYLDIHGLSKGYLVIFDDRKKKDFTDKWIKKEGKEIFAIWI